MLTSIYIKRTSLLRTANVSCHFRSFSSSTAAAAAAVDVTAGSTKNCCLLLLLLFSFFFFAIVLFNKQLLRVIMNERLQNNYFRD